MKIVNLYDNQEFVPQIANWLYLEFYKNIRAGFSLDDVNKLLGKAQKNTIPLTYVGMNNDECIGTVSLVINDLQERQDLTPWLGGLYISEEYRSYGYARKLIAHVIETAGRLGFNTLYLRTEGAADYYKNLGWKKIYETIDEFKLFTEVFEIAIGARE